ncbi:MAG: CotH kinase family protein [Clostridia bacterium]|nr:CotH kinase family protein [Clostridia bacterium]
MQKENKKQKHNKTKIMKIVKTIVFVAILLLLVVIVFVPSKNKNSISDKEKTHSVSINQEQQTEKNSIPKMFFTGNINEMQEKSDKRQIQVKYESDNLKFESYAILKVQGSYTLKFDKKNYNITFYEDEECNKKKKYDMKWGEYSKYTLKANWTDPLHSRNIVTAQIASEINKKYGILADSINYGLTDGFPIEIYINNDFLGLYTLNIHKDYLFNLDDKDENNIAIFANTPEPQAFEILETEEWNNYELEFGKNNEETLEKFNRLIDFIKNSSDEQFINDFDNYFNKDSVLNYYCLMNFAHLIDNVTRNIFLVTYDGKVWYMIPYDFDQSWGNEFRDYSIITDYENRHTSYYIQISPLWNRFKKLLKKEIDLRYKELRKDILTKENVINKMNSFYSLIPNNTLEKEQKKWNNKPDYERTYINEYLDNELIYLDRIYGLSK